MQKEKVNFDGQKGAQISIEAKNIVTKGWHQSLTTESKQALYYIKFLFSCWYAHVM